MNRDFDCLITFLQQEKYHFSQSVSFTLETVKVRQRKHSFR